MSHATLTRIYITVELEDGTVHEDLRVVYKDQAAFMKTARLNNWPAGDAARQNSFLAWKAGHRLGLWTHDYDTFEADHLLDLDVAEVKVEEDKTEDPTPAS